MKKWIYGFMFLVGGAVSAAMGLPVLGIYLGGLAIGLLFFWLIRKGLKALPKKTFDTVNKMADKRLQKETTGEPYITTHHGPEGIKGLEVGFDDEEDGQPGAKFNPMSITQGVIDMRKEEAKARTAQAVQEILTSELPYQLKLSALAQLEKQSIVQTPSNSTKPRLRRRKSGDDVVGLSEGNYSI